MQIALLGKLRHKDGSSTDAHPTGHTFPLHQYTLHGGPSREVVHKSRNGQNDAQAACPATNAANVSEVKRGEG